MTPNETHNINQTTAFDIHQTQVWCPFNKTGFSLGRLETVAATCYATCDLVLEYIRERVALEIPRKFEFTL